MMLDQIEYVIGCWFKLDIRRIQRTEMLSENRDMLKSKEEEHDEMRFV